MYAKTRNVLMGLNSPLCNSQKNRMCKKILLSTRCKERNMTEFVSSTEIPLRFKSKVHGISIQPALTLGNEFCPTMTDTKKRSPPRDGYEGCSWIHGVSDMKMCVAVYNVTSQL